MKTKLMVVVAALILAPIMVYIAAELCIEVRIHKSDSELELITGIPGMRDAAIASVGGEGEFPAGSHVSAALRIQYRVGKKYCWADEVTGELDVGDNGNSGKLTLSQRAHNIIYAEAEITVTDKDGETQTYTLKTQR